MTSISLELWNWFLRESIRLVLVQVGVDSSKLLPFIFVCMSLLLLPRFAQDLLVCGLSSDNSEKLDNKYWVLYKQSSGRHLEESAECTIANYYTDIQSASVAY